MKNSILVLTFFMFSIHLFGQNSGLGFNYQAVVRGSDGYVLPSQSVELRFSLMPGKEATQASWVETHSVTTDAFGTFGVMVGKGEKAGGDAASFAAINFAAVYYWLKVEIMEGGNWRELSCSALASVPYAEVANNSESNETFDRNFEEIRNELARLIPPGTIVPFGGGTVPAGWLPCDGTSVSCTTYEALFNAIGTAWGGNGTTTFNVPDLRGMFLRGYAGTSNDDADKDSRMSRNGGNSGNQVGSYQEDAIRNMTGRIGVVITWGSNRGTTASGVFSGSYIPTAGKAPTANQTNGWYGDTDINFNATNAGVPTGSDNRPKNVYVNYIIKY